MEYGFQEASRSAPHSQTSEKDNELEHQFETSFGWMTYPDVSFCMAH